MHPDEFGIDAHLVRRLISEQFPQWEDLRLERVRSTGTVNAIYRLGDEMCVRLPRTPGAARDVAREERWLPHLGRCLPLRVPTLLAVGQPAAEYPLTWTVYSWLAGDTFEVGLVGDLEAASDDIANFINALHRIDGTDAPRSGGSGPLAVRDEAVRAVIDSLGDRIDAAAAKRAWGSSLAAREWDGNPVWIHGDLIPPNVLVEAGRVSAVIDFDESGVGDPALDVIAAWSLLPASVRGLFREAIEVDDATWIRGRGWALSKALFIIPYYENTNPEFVAMADRMVNEILAEFEEDG